MNETTSTTVEMVEIARVPCVDIGKMSDTEVMQFLYKVGVEPDPFDEE